MKHRRRLPAARRGARALGPTPRRRAGVLPILYVSTDEIRPALCVRRYVIACYHEHGAAAHTSSPVQSLHATHAAAGDGVFVRWHAPRGRSARNRPSNGLLNRKSQSYQIACIVTRCGVCCAHPPLTQPTLKDLRSSYVWSPCQIRSPAPLEETLRALPLRALHLCGSGTASLPWSK